MKQRCRCGHTASVHGATKGHIPDYVSSHCRANITDLWGRVIRPCGCKEWKPQGDIAA